MVLGEGGGQDGPAAGPCWFEALEFPLSVWHPATPSPATTSSMQTFFICYAMVELR